MSVQEQASPATSTPWVPLWPLTPALAYGTTLPSSPVDGQEAILVDSLTSPTYQWRFRYNAGSTSPYKWEFIGGAPAYHEVATGEAITAAGGWVNLATNGPLITVPRAGDYLAEYSVMSYNANGSAITMYAGIALGDTGALHYAGQIIYFMNALGGIGNCGGNYKVAGAAVNDVIKLRYFATAITGTDQQFQMRTLAVTPVRVA